MVVISVSMTGKDLHQFDELVEHMGYKSRSSAVRDALYHFVSNHRLDFQETAEVVLTLVYQADASQDVVHETVHEFQDAIRTSIHNHMGDQCVDVLIASGPSSKIHTLMDKLTAIKDLRVSLSMV